MEMFQFKKFKALHRYNIKAYSLYPDNELNVSNVRNVGKRFLFFEKINAKFKQSKNLLSNFMFKNSPEVSKHSVTMDKNESNSVKYALLGKFKHSDFPTAFINTTDSKSGKIGESFSYASPAIDYFDGKDKEVPLSYNPLQENLTRSYLSNRKIKQDKFSYKDSNYFKKLEERDNLYEKMRRNWEEMTRNWSRGLSKRSKLRHSKAVYEMKFADTFDELFDRMMSINDNNSETSDVIEAPIKEEVPQVVVVSKAAALSQKLYDLA